MSEVKKLKEDDRRKLLKNLEKELVYLGMMQGNKIESRDLHSISTDNDTEFLGSLRKELHNGLVMEFVFSSNNGITNFHLNDVDIDLKKVEDDMLIKLFKIIRGLNNLYKAKMEEKEREQEELDNEKESEKEFKEDEKEKRRKEVLRRL